MNEFVVESTRIAAKLLEWYENKSGVAKSSLWFAAPPGSGKTQALKSAFGPGRKKNVIYFEYFGGFLRKDQTCLMALHEIYLSLQKNTQLKSWPQPFKGKLDLSFIDGKNFFNLYIAEPLNSIDTGNEQILIIIDGPERCEPNSQPLLWDILINSWGELIVNPFVRLIISTSRPIASHQYEWFDNIPEDVFSLAVRQLLVESQCISSKLDHLIELCHGNLFFAKYLLLYKIHLQEEEDPSLPTTLEDCFEKFYDRKFACLFCTRLLLKFDEINEEMLQDYFQTNSPEDLKNRKSILSCLSLFSSSYAFRDWLCSKNELTYGHEQILVSYDELSEISPYFPLSLVYHALELGKFNYARRIFLNFPGFNLFIGSI